MFKKVLSAAVLAVVMSTHVQAAGPAPDQNQRQFEIRFMTDMIDHHAMAVMMSELCLERAINPELLELCHQIREMQLEEIATLQTWLEEWYGIHHEPEMTPGAENHMAKMAELSAEEFEVEFMKSMIRHHWMAVVRAGQCQDMAYHAELIQLCHHMEAAQLAEIELMGSWLCAWYDVCNYHNAGT